MKRHTVLLLACLWLVSCSGRPAAHPAEVSAAPGVSSPVPIITPYGNTISCQAAPGAVCVQH